MNKREPTISIDFLTSTCEIEGKGEGSKTAKKVVGGAGLGALIAV